MFNCAAIWVEEGVSIRTMTLAESIEARRIQANRDEWLQGPLEFAEIPGFRFDPPASGVAATRREGKLVWDAHQFFMSAVA